MRDFTTQPWQTTITRWGDTVFSLALLWTDDRTAAEHVTLHTFTQSFAAGGDLSEDALFRALIQQRPRRFQPRALIPRRWQRHALPEPLTRIAPLDRVLLALWLLYGIDHVRLASIAQMEQAALHKRLAVALLRITTKPALIEDGMVNAVAAWIGQIPGGNGGKVAQFQSAESDTTRAWTAALETTRTALRTTVGHRRLPLHCADAIAAEAYTQADGASRWWHRRPIWIGAILAMVGVVLLLLIKPWSSGASASATQPPTPAEIVQQTIDAWTTLPNAGTLHRRVWAKPVLTTSDEPLITDVWLTAASAQHRVEVRREGKLVEWQVADGRQRFEYAGQPYLSSCQWGDPSALDRRTQSFQVPPADVAAARDARLKLGAYGVGYQMLQQALIANDLRSFGTRVEGDTALMALSYTDTTGPYQRRMLLWIDPKAKELRLAQELTGAKDGNAGRDVWRLQVREELDKGVPLDRPEWMPSDQQRKILLDPACPGLDVGHVVSLRTTISRPDGWYEHFLPAVLPSGITRAAILNASAFSTQANDPQNNHIVFVGPGRWLQLRFTSHNASDLHQGERHGNWTIAFNDKVPVMAGTACQVRSDNDICFPSLAFNAHGWTSEEVIALMTTLKPIDAQLWQHYDALFLDPQPLSAEAKDVLLHALEAQRFQGNALYLKGEWTTRVEAERRVLDDPYHVPLHIQLPERLYQEQWFVYSGAEIVKYKEVMTLPDGTLYNSQSNNGTRVAGYDIRTGVANQSLRNSEHWWFAPPQTPANQVIKHLFGSTQPISIERLDGAIQLTQIQQPDVQPDSTSLTAVEMDPFVGPYSPWLGNLTTGSYRYRVWLNDVTYLPMRAESSFIDQQGRATELTSVVMHEWQQQDAISDDTLMPPALPAASILFDAQERPELRSVAEPGNLFFMERALMWPDAAGLKLVDDTNPSDAYKDEELRSNLRLHEAVWMPLQRMDQLGLIKMTSYQLPNETNRIIVRQGPRLLLRHALRHNPLIQGQGRGNMWNSSTSIPVVIDGKQRIAWQIEDSFNIQSLVVEVDDVLLHISGADQEYLQQRVPELLSRMVWTDLSK